MTAGRAWPRGLFPWSAPVLANQRLIIIGAIRFERAFIIDQFTVISAVTGEKWITGVIDGDGVFDPVIILSVIKVQARLGILNLWGQLDT